MTNFFIYVFLFPFLFVFLPFFLEVQFNFSVLKVSVWSRLRSFPTYRCREGFLLLRLNKKLVCFSGVHQVRSNWGLSNETNTKWVILFRFCFYCFSDEEELVLITDLAVAFWNVGPEWLWKFHFILQEAADSVGIFDSKQEDIFLVVMQDVVVRLIFHDRQSLADHLFGQQLLWELRGKSQQFFKNFVIV